MRHERRKNIPNTEKLALVCKDARSTKLAQNRHFFETRSASALEQLGITATCREYTHFATSTDHTRKERMETAPELDLFCNDMESR